jgi:HEAT repeat protein
VRALLTVLLVAIASFGMPQPSRAHSVDSLKKDLTSAVDYRVRMSAALALGKSKDASSVGALVSALGDQHVAVRASAAAALGSLGQASALAPLESAKERESEAAVRREIEAAILKIRAQSPKAKVLVQMGRLENKSGNPKLGPAFQKIARDELSRLPGVELLGEQADAALESKRRRLPTVALDGRLVQVQKAQSAREIGYSAKVEFLIRKLPDQALKGTVRGDARASTDPRAVKSASEHALLQEDAVVAAVQSAFKGAPVALEAAGR